MHELGLEVVVKREEVVPWQGVSKIPWADPEFSRRMLEQHLDQEHPGASRTFETIDRHVEWIETALLEGRPNAKILDLCCGPGLYCVRLAARGHRCRGIDFSPASIEHAKKLTAEQGRDVSFELGDVLEAPLGDGYDLVMITYGELNTFSPDHARKLVRRVAGALAPGGVFAVEIHKRDDVRRVGEAIPIWHSAESGLFGDAPYICLRENYWFEDASAAVSRYFVIDVATGQVTTYQNTLQAYADESYEELMKEAGVGELRRADALSGNPEDAGGLFVLFGTRS